VNFSCASNGKIDIEHCSKLDNKSTEDMAKKMLVVDTSWKSDFAIDYAKKGFSLTDKKNNWTRSFSDEYFDIIIMYANNNYIVLYCPRSGIERGYKLMGKKYHDIYLFDRVSGKPSKIFKSERGLANATIGRDTIYFALKDPDEIRFSPF
jgi:hypothetical protein